MKEFYPSECEMDHLSPAATCTADEILSPDLRAQWAEEGILRIPGVFKPLLVAALKASVTTEPGAAATRAGNRGLLARSRPVRALAVSDPALELARALAGAAARPVKATLFDKAEGANWTLPWHQDLTVAPRKPADAPDFRAGAGRAASPTPRRRSAF